MATTPNRPAGLNRSLLTVVGVMLLLGGAYTLLRGFGLVPTHDRAATLLPTDPTVPSWLPYAVIAGAVVVGVVCLFWLAAQVGRRRTSSQTWRLPGEGANGTTMLDTDAAADAVAEEIDSYPGVRRTVAAITGGRTEPFLHLTVTTEDDAAVTDLRSRIATDALPRLRAALEIEDLPTEILLRLGTGGPAHRLS
ncbi:alkaline shock response membrane anchor protein AmaP [Pseudonocardia pini]|uniref:alkaline shock response membrane anchor protein AmaP n=1 Tax=Pseudonocardia pini TaxID=2758030 RepID=UPI0015F0F3DB|nr:alkaline shock response membrane anchor protein AmaP [Pseudonocardia pini]